MEQDKYIVFNCDLKIPEAGFGLIASLLLKSINMRAWRN